MVPEPGKLPVAACIIVEPWSRPAPALAASFMTCALEQPLRPLGLSQHPVIARQMQYVAGPEA